MMAHGTTRLSCRTHRSTMLRLCTQVKLQHESLRTSVLQGHKFSTLLVGQKASDMVGAKQAKVPAMA